MASAGWQGGRRHTADGYHSPPRSKKPGRPMSSPVSVANGWLVWCGLHRPFGRFAVGDLEGAAEVVADLRFGVGAHAFVDAGEDVADGAGVVLDVHAVGGGRAVKLATLEGAAAQDD